MPLLAKASSVRRSGGSPEKMLDVAVRLLKSIGEEVEVRSLLHDICAFVAIALYFDY